MDLLSHRKASMAKKARKDEMEKAAPRNPSTTRKRKIKRKRGASAAATSGLCDDLIRNIFVRLPARTLVASMALSKHHRRMILCPEFSCLHCSLGPPLPRPHVAYISTAMISNKRCAVSASHRFRVAGRRSRDAPTRSLTGPRYLNMKYINTCNGVLLFADSRRCVFLNPCVANGEQEVDIPASTTNGDCVLGFGYGKRSQTYKVLLSRKCEGTSSYDKYPRDLLVYSLRDDEDAGEQPRVRTVLSGKQEGDGFFYKRDPSGRVFISSLYIDGMVYLFHVQKRVVFAIDVDDETVTTINLPGKGYISDDYLQMSRLMEMSGRPCIETSEWRDNSDKCHILWVLKADHQWEEKCVIKKQDGYDRCSINGVWECGGALVLHLNGLFSDPNWLYLVLPSSTMKMFRTYLPPNLKPELSEYAFCWGYKPTLVPPGSIIGELDQEEKRTQGHTSTDIIRAVKRLNKQEKREGRKATARVVCLMEVLAGVLSGLPENTQEVIETLRSLI